MPFLNLNELQGSPVFIGETEFVNPDDEKDSVDLKIYLAAPKFTSKVQNDFGSNGDAFIKDLKSYVNQFDRKVLAEKVQADKGISVVLNGVKCELKHGEHFWIDARDMMGKQ